MSINTEDLFYLIDDLLPDNKIVLDIYKLLLSENISIPYDGVNVCINIDDADENDEPTTIKANVDVAIITKAVFKEYTKSLKFATYKVMVAIGGIKEEAFGIITPVHFFAMLYYTENLELFTSDFHNKMR